VTRRVSAGRRREGGLPAASRRVLFPIACRSLALPAVEVALEIARAERATLVAAYLRLVPLRLGLDDAPSTDRELALPVLEVVDRSASRAGVSVERRIERGRSHRHALRKLVEQEPHDLIVVIAGAGNAAGLAPVDIAWLLRHGACDIVVLRPGDRAAGRGLTPAA
jgi:nucleotide-binding universal stress UspA family protein